MLFVSRLWCFLGGTRVHCPHFHASCPFAYVQLDVSFQTFCLHMPVGFFLGSWLTSHCWVILYLLSSEAISFSTAWWMRHTDHISPCEDILSPTFSKALLVMLVTQLQMLSNTKYSPVSKILTMFSSFTWPHGKSEMVVLWAEGWIMALGTKLGLSTRYSISVLWWFVSGSNRIEQAELISQEDKTNDIGVCFSVAAIKLWPKTWRKRRLIWLILLHHWSSSGEVRAGFQAGTEAGSMEECFFFFFTNFLSWLSQLPILYSPRPQAQCLPAHSWLGLPHLSLIKKNATRTLIDLPVGQSYWGNSSVYWNFFHTIYSHHVFLSFSSSSILPIPPTQIHVFSFFF